MTEHFHSLIFGRENRKAISWWNEWQAYHTDRTSGRLSGIDRPDEANGYSRFAGLTFSGARELIRVELGLYRRRLVGSHSFGRGPPAELCATIGRGEPADGAREYRANGYRAGFQR